MKILVTGAKGFVGRNLCAQLNNIKSGKARCYGDLTIDEVFEYDLDSMPEQLEQWCAECEFVFNLAGVNRPQNPEDFMKGNFGFASTLLDTLKKHGNKAPVMLSSSAQASLTGRFGNSEYGRSKKAGEDLFLQYGEENGVKVLVYRFPNLYGKWCRQTTTPPSPLSVITLPMTFQSLSMTQVLNWRCFTSTTWWKR